MARRQRSTAAVKPGIVERIAMEVAAAKEISRTFNEQVVALREDQAMQALRSTPPRNVTIEAQESEPNDDSLSTNQLALEAWITAAIAGGKDADYFTFTTPPTHRDIMRIELQNRSPTLEPRLELFDARRASIGSVKETTPGADLSYSFVAEPGTSYSVKASNYYGETGGLYLLRVMPTEAFDRHEPNDAILSATAVAPGTPVEAGIMDKTDEDFFSVRGGDARERAARRHREPLHDAAARGRHLRRGQGADRQLPQHHGRRRRELQLPGPGEGALLRARARLLPQRGGRLHAHRQRAPPRRRLIAAPL